MMPCRSSEGATAEALGSMGVLRAHRPTDHAADWEDGLLGPSLHLRSIAPGCAVGDSWADLSRPCEDAAAGVEDHAEITVRIAW